MIKRTNNWRHLLGLALAAAMLSGVVLAGCGGGSDDSAATNTANKPAKDDIGEP